ncbi:MAG: FAD:protein FMN transferase, partial [Clostridia bacterium]|nr:FAD:protein FMN transferase [Clostridia bacterium]
MIHRKPRRLLAAILAAVLIVSQTACTAQTGPGTTVSEKTSFGEDWLLNTYCYIQVFEEGCEDLIREAFGYARGLENLLSRTIETSDIGRFNASEEGCEVDWQTAA